MGRTVNLKQPDLITGCIGLSGTILSSNQHMLCMCLSSVTIDQIRLHLFQPQPTLSVQGPVYSSALDHGSLHAIEPDILWDKAKSWQLATCYAAGQQHPITLGIPALMYVLCPTAMVTIVEASGSRPASFIMCMRLACWQPKLSDTTLTSGYSVLTSDIMV